MRRGERGATAVIVAIVLALLCGFLALSLEVGHMMSVRGELQNGADAAALAGAKRLDGTNDDFQLAGARANAFNYARSHPTDRWDVEPSVVQLGAWVPGALACGAVGGTQQGSAGPDGHKFCSITADTPEAASNINAVRVVAARQGTPGSQGGGGIEMPFGAFVGQSGPKAVSAEAIAVTGGPCDEGCPELPFAIKASCVKQGAAEIQCGKLFAVGMGSSGVDSAGLTVFKEATCDSSTGTQTSSDDDKLKGSGWGTQDICDVLDDECSHHPVAGKCISIKNGTNVAGQCQGAAEKICCEVRKKVGKVGQVPLVEYAAGESCAGGFGDFNYVHAAKIVGIGSARLVAAKCEVGGCSATCPEGAVWTAGSGGGKGACVMPGYEGAAADCLFSNGHCFILEFVCDEEDDDQTTVGCGWYGTSPLQPVLVR